MPDNYHRDNRERDGRDPRDWDRERERDNRGGHRNHNNHNSYGHGQGHRGKKSNSHYSKQHKGNRRSPSREREPPRHNFQQGVTTPAPPPLSEVLAESSRDGRDRAWEAHRYGSSSNCNSNSNSNSNSRRSGWPNLYPGNRGWSPPEKPMKEEESRDSNRSGWGNPKSKDLKRKRDRSPGGGVVKVEDEGSGHGEAGPSTKRNFAGGSSSTSSVEAATTSSILPGLVMESNRDVQNGKARQRENESSSVDAQNQPTARDSTREDSKPKVEIEDDGFVVVGDLANGKLQYSHLQCVELQCSFRFPSKLQSVRLISTGFETEEPAALTHKLEEQRGINEALKVFAKIDAGSCRQTEAKPAPNGSAPPWPLTNAIPQGSLPSKSEPAEAVPTAGHVQLPPNPSTDQAPTAPEPAQAQPLFTPVEPSFIPSHSVQYVNDLKRALRERDKDLELSKGDTAAVTRSFNELKGMYHMRVAEIADLQSTIEGRSRGEIAALEGTIRERDMELVVAKHTVREQATKIGELNSTLQTQGMQIGELNGTINTQGTKIGELGRTLRERDAEIAELKNQLNRAQDYNRWANLELDDARRTAEEAREAATSEGMRAHNVEEELTKAKKLLGDRTEELNVAQAFMVTADKFSVADVSRLVEQLNDDVYQCAVMVSDAVMDQRYAVAGKGEADSEEELKVVKEARKLVVEVWSEEVVARYQADIAERDDSVLFEAVVQNVLVMRLKGVIQKMYLGPKGGSVNETLVDMWEGIKKTHEVSIAKNWLSMAHSQLKHHPIEQADIMRQLLSLTYVAGYRVRKDGTPGCDLPKRLEEKLDEMTQKALKIKEMAAEGVLSSEIDVVAFNPRKSFDSEKMQDAFAVEPKTPKSKEKEKGGGKHGKGKGKGREKAEGKPPPIVVSTGLGVSCSSKGRTEVVLKCKVLLQTMLESTPTEGVGIQGISAMPGIESPD
ncbi:hypothetical protein D9611_003547 [Ephemerocybe angulata]|uniref:Uncharacterized protein n=1 Tax=Ephemerocybe angulata TaxID=980116 RepID=A0A8H5B5Q3_9AGAR|nr:hypothetical protein D9611_003547 [Tulosesus angulatus]